MSEIVKIFKECIKKNRRRAEEQKTQKLQNQ